MPCLRQTSALVGALSASCKIAMICSSLNRCFMPLSYPEHSRLTFYLDQFTGSRRWLLSSRLHGGALGKRDQLIHGPLVIGMGPVFHRFNPPGRRDQKVARKAEWASRKPQAKMAMSHPAYGGAQGLEAN